MTRGAKSDDEPLGTAPGLLESKSHLVRRFQRTHWARSCLFLAPDPARLEFTERLQYLGIIWRLLCFLDVVLALDLPVRVAELGYGGSDALGVSDAGEVQLILLSLGR